MEINSADVKMYDLVLEDLSQDGAFYPWRRQESGGLGPRVLNHTATVDADIVEWTLDAAQQPSAPDEHTIVDLLVRNSITVSLEQYAPKHGAKLVSPRHLCKHFNGRNPRIGRTDRCIIRFALPGYSRGNHAACVFFWFEDGGADGGGTGIYWFEKIAGSWMMRSKCVSYHGKCRHMRPTARAPAIQSTAACGLI